MEDDLKIIKKIQCLMSRIIGRNNNDTIKDLINIINEIIPDICFQYKITFGTTMIMKISPNLYKMAPNNSDLKIIYF
jgi:hypothetical protein